MPATPRARLLLACDVAQLGLGLQEGVEGREGLLGARLVGVGEGVGVGVGGFAPSPPRSN